MNNQMKIKPVLHKNGGWWFCTAKIGTKRLYEAWGASPQEAYFHLKDAMKNTMTYGDISHMLAGNEVNNG